MFWILQARVKVNRLPFPNSLSNEILPPCCSTRRFVIASPNPVPSLAVSVLPSTWRNSSKTAAWCSARIPIPVSVTDIRTSSPFSLQLMSIRPVLWREFDRVAEQVIENLLKTNPIRIHWKIGLDFMLNLDILCHR